MFGIRGERLKRREVHVEVAKETEVGITLWLPFVLTVTPCFRATCGVLYKRLLLSLSNHII
jgi:hypothetical protein